MRTLYLYGILVNPLLYFINYDCFQSWSSINQEFVHTFGRGINRENPTAIYCAVN